MGAAGGPTLTLWARSFSAGGRTRRPAAVPEVGAIGVEGGVRDEAGGDDGANEVEVRIPGEVIVDMPACMGTA